MKTTFKPFHEMTEEDYAEIGLKAGLEIHQQLLTEKKLFCRCPAGHYSDDYDAEILRHMRPTLSELGEYDGTALMEFKTKKEIIYQINHKTVCTYEMDDTPPFEINQKALDIALEIAMLLNYKLVSEIHISRKQYLDGSIPAGFQRSTIVGVDGWIPYKGRKIGLIQLGLEEDACREVSDIGHTRVYLTDRLGMPLIEPVTQPDMHTPQEVADVANILRWSVRSTGKVRTGIGAARQDVNVSINGGTRAEIKGVPRIPLIPLLIYNEAYRQYSLLQIRDALHKRGITNKTLQTATANVTHHLRDTNWEPVRQALHQGDEIHCVNLKGFEGILRHPTQTGKVFSKEISDRIRVVACITRLPNMLTSESMEETIDSFTWNKIQKAVCAGPKDSLVLVWGNKQDVKTAVQEVIIRAREAATCIPNETRQALADGTNGFERILPGPNRMYPDTDLPPLEISTTLIKRLEHNVLENTWIRIKKYKKLGLPEHLHLIIASSPKATLFESLAKLQNIPPVRIAGYLFEKIRSWKRQGLNINRLKAQDWKSFFKQAEKQPALLEIGEDIFKDLLRNSKDDLEDRLKKYNSPKVVEKNLEKSISKAIKKESNTFASDEKKHRFFMGKIMRQFRGYVQGEKVNEVLWEIMRKNGVQNE